ncbi:LLM class flavin-dependent oxidoreductase [Streptomyces sp. NPDC091272]|uniref:LLM class flavin-dependent oxidoreductase n=1 Tax=Streptomyces sp. NPDC091272 TaxID=3365981 RepID=UPI00380AD7D5
MASAVSRPLHIGAEVGGGASVGGLVRLAEEGALDLVTLSTAVGDAVGLLARVAGETSGIGLVPTVTVTGADPFVLQAAVAELDRVSRGRAGWAVAVSAPAGASAAPAGASARELDRPEPAGSAEELWREAGAVVDVSTRLWDGRDPGVGAGDTSTGRFVDPGTVGRPVTVVDVSVCGADGLAVAAHYADVVIVRAHSPGEAGALRADLRRRAAVAGREPGALRILAALTVDLAGEPLLHGPSYTETDPVRVGRGGAAEYTGGPVGLAQVLTRWHAADVVDGFHITPLSPERDLERLVNGTVNLLQHHCLHRHFYAGATLRDHLGLRLPAARRARSGAGKAV